MKRIRYLIWVVAGVAGCLVAAAVTQTLRGPRHLVVVPADVPCTPEQDPCVRGVVRMGKRPVEGAVVGVFGHGPPSAHLESVFVGEPAIADVKTAADGTFHIPVVSSAGTYLQVHDDRAVSPPFLVQPNTGDVQVRMLKGGAVAGSVRGGAGTARLARLFRGMRVPTLHTAPLDEMGRFWFGGLPDGTYVVSVALEEGLTEPPSMTVQVHAGQTSRVGPFRVSERH